MKKRGKKILSLLLAMCMVTCMMPSMAYASNERIAINEINFPDAKFRNYVASKFDKDYDHFLSSKEIEDVTYISCPRKGISSLKGIEYFTNLNRLNCSCNNLYSLDVSKNTLLERLECSENQLSSLDIRNNNKLTYLECRTNRLTELDISCNRELTDLYCINNRLSTLDVSNNPNLIVLYCSSNVFLDALDISNCISLGSLICSDTSISKLDLSKNTELRYLDCSGTNLKNLDVSKNTWLGYLDCGYTKLTELDVRKNYNMHTLVCSGLGLKYLDVSNNFELEKLMCENNNLAVLNLESNTELSQLKCNNNNLIELDVSNLPMLQILDCKHNNLTVLDVSKNQWLSYLDCGYNNLTSVEISRYAYISGSFSCLSNSRYIAVSSEGHFDLSNLSDRFDKSKASNWTNGNIEGNILKVDKDAEYVTYSYDCGGGEKAVFKLVPHTHTEMGVWESNFNGSHTRNCAESDCEYSETEKCAGGNATCGKRAVCTICGQEYGDFRHSMVESTDTGRRKCEICGILECDAYGHLLSKTWEYNENSHWQRCSRAGCGEQLKYSQHSGGTATCIKRATCGSCGQEYGSFGSHAWEKATCKAKAFCIVCSEEKGTFDATNHDGGFVIKNSYPPTCTTSGSTGELYCLGCGQMVQDKSPIAPLGHSFGAWIISKEPTYAAEGEKYRQCQNEGCTHIETKIIPPLLPEWAGGAGVKEDPYIVKTKEQLSNIRWVKSAYYRLDADIIFDSSDFQKDGEFYNDGAGWVPIGDSDIPFSGSFDGNNHIIKNIVVNEAEADNIGIFGVASGSIKNMGVVNAKISGKKYVGAVTGQNKGCIEKCFATGTIIAEQYAGGISGENTGSIMNCYNGAKAVGVNYCGGITGQNSGEIKFSYNIGKLETKAIRGSVVGENTASGALTSCYYLAQNMKGVGKGEDTAAEISYRDKSKAEAYAAFDFETIWEIRKDGDYTLPTLRNLPNHATLPGNTVEFAGGKGTAESPYIIKTKEQLNNVRNYLDAHYRLYNDIVFNEEDFISGGQFYNLGNGWIPIGTDEKNAFTGTFDGNGHMIKGLVCKRPEESYIGLFAASDGTIKSLGMGECKIVGKYVTGTIVGANGKNGVVFKCFNTSDFTSTSEYNMAGIVGSNSGVIRYCYNTGELNSFNGAFGIAADNNGSGLIEFCYNTGNITVLAKRPSAAGVAGYNSGTIRGCYNTGAITTFIDGDGLSVMGGIAQLSSGKIYASYNVGTIVSLGLTENSGGSAQIGGIVGIFGGELYNCYNAGTIKASTGTGSFVAGIVPLAGENDYIAQVYNAGRLIAGKGAQIGSIAAYVSIGNFDPLSNGYYRDQGLDETISILLSAHSESLTSMQKQSTYNGFNFTNVWNISSKGNYKLPILRNLPNEEYQYTYVLDTLETPSAPKLRQVTANSIEIKAVLGQMYLCTDSAEIPKYTDSAWKAASSTEMTFTELKDNTTYRIYTYIPVKEDRKRSNISVALKVETVQYGKFTGAGNPNSADAMYLKRALAGWDGYDINIYAADVNNDGKVNESDVMTLERHIAGWKGYETLPVKKQIS